MNWQDKPQVKMGNIGEQIAKDYLLKRGFVPYSADKEAGAHPFDFLCATRDKKSVFIAEVKTKPSRLYYPDTGFNVSSYETYKNIRQNHNMEVYCFFVDVHKRAVYGESLSKLEKATAINHNGKTIQYPFVQKGVIYFPLEAMEVIAQLTPEQCREIEQHKTRSYEY